MTTKVLQQRLDRTREDLHARCIACGNAYGQTMRLRFAPTSDGAVEGVFKPGPSYEGYAGILHGGVIATLLDAAMTHCLFAQGRRAVTADLHIRYRHPVGSEDECHLRASIERSSPPLFLLRAELWQAGQLRTTATAKFLETGDAPSAC